MNKLSLALCLFTSISAFAWENQNDPSIFNRNYNYKFDSLPKTGNLSDSKMPWSNTYWPGMLGGIAFRWFETMPRENIGFNQFHTYAIPTEGQVRRMSYEELKKLSPAEKYDLYMGNFDFKLTKIVKGATSAADQYWEGLCNGWATAALEFEEPKPVDAVSPVTGMTIPFGTSDLKALLSYYHFHLGSKASTTMIGRRCNVSIPEATWTSDANINPDCIDINPGAFHVVLTNQIGLMDQGFVIEITRDSEIWNQPMYGYEVRKEETRKFLTTNKTPGTVKQVEMEVAIFYADDGGYEYWEAHEEGEEIYVSWNPTTGTPDYKSDDQVYKYVLDLNSQGKIIGGTWIGYLRPDFIWIKRDKGFVSKGPMKDVLTGNKIKYLWNLKNLVELR